MSMHKRKADESETDSKKDGKKHLPILQRCSNLPILQGCSSSRKNKIEETRKKLFLCFRIPGFRILWFRIDPPHSATEDSTKISIPDLVSSVPDAEEISKDCDMAHLGSKIYMVAGDNEVYRKGQGSKVVLSFDTAAGSDFVCHKEEQPHLLVKRGPATAVSTHGKIYVFGSVDTDDSWGEVFDPKLNTWSPLPEPPSSLRLNQWSIRFGNAVIGHKILLSSYCTLFSFDVKTYHWEDITSIHPGLHQQLSNTGLAFDHNILFYFYHASLRAYDFSTKRWHKIKGLGIKSFSSSTPEDLDTGYVVRLGGEDTFCALWTDKYRLYVRCLKFRVKRVNCSNGHLDYFQGEVLGRSTYQIPLPGTSFAACFRI